MWIFPILGLPVLKSEEVASSWVLFRLLFAPTKVEIASMQ